MTGPDGQPADVAPLVEAAAHAGVLFSGGDDGRIRAVTHYGITADDIGRALAAVEQALAATRTSPERIRSAQGV